MELGKAYLELATSTRGLAPGIRKEFGAIEREMNVSGGKAGKEFSKGFGKRSMLGKVMDGALMGVGMGAVNKLAGAAKGVFDVAIGGGFNRAINIEQAKSKLDGLGHSAESVKSIMDNASAAVKGTAFGLGDAAAVAASTVAAGVKPGADLERTLKLVGDAATIAGADMGEMGAVFNKVAASNKLQMDSVNQLQDRGIPVLQLVAEEMGVTQEEAAKLASAGKVSFETFQNAMEEGMGGAALNSGKTFAGAMANTKAALGRIGESFLTPLMGTIGSLAQAAIPVIDTIGAMLKPVAEQFGSWLEKQTPRITAFLEKVPGYLQTASEKVSALWALVKDSAVGDYIQTLWESAQSLGSTLRDNLAPVFETVVALVTEKVLPFFQRLGEIIMSVLGPAFSTVVGLVRDHVIPVLGTIAEFVYGRLIPAIYDFGNNILLPIFNDVATFVREKFLPVFSSFVAYITDNVIPVVKDFADRVLIPAFEMIGGAMKWWWDTIGWPIFNTLWDVITNLVGPALSWLWESAFKPAFTKMGDAMDAFGRNWAGIWNGIKAAAAGPVNFVIETVWNDGLRKALNLIPGVNLPEARGITVPSGNARSGGGRKALTAFATGGYVDLPWSAVNRDPYLGVTAQGGAFRFEGEEFIVNRDATRKHRELLEAINADRLPGYATGGAVRPVPQGHSGWKGGYYRSGKYHGGLDFPAPIGTAIRAMWDGVVTKALRLNRSYGHHAQISHGGLSTLYAHMSRLIVSAGQRIARGQTIGYVGSTGNALDVETPVLTDNRGWVRHGDLVVGDVVYDEGGSPVNVTHVAHWEDRPTYRITFTDGSVIDADENHLWAVHDFKERRRGNGGLVVRTTKEIADTYAYGVTKEYKRYAVPVAGGIERAEKRYRIDPYALGVWLGDGHAANAQVTVGREDLQDMQENLLAVGETFNVSPDNGHWRLTLIGAGVPDGEYNAKTGTNQHPNAFSVRLKELGLIGNKRIPREYMEGSYSQRLALLQGLLDADGYVDGRQGTIEFVQAGSHGDLARDVWELALSLGFKATLRTGHASLRGKRTSTKYRVCFTTDVTVFRMPRKAKVQAVVAGTRSDLARERIARRGIASVERVDNRDTNCITVDGASHLYLAGESLIPTHNSSGPHLHLEVRRGGTRLNPEPYLSGAARMSGGDMAPDAAGEDPAIMNAIDKVPAMFKKVRDSLGELTGPWGSLFKQGVTDAVKTAADWALGKIPGLGDLLAFITGKKRDGYAGGTLSASPGWSWVGERGPELVHFRGGERVLSHQDSMRATQPAPTLVRVELVDERMRGLIRAEVRQMQREGLVYA